MWYLITNGSVRGKEGGFETYDSWKMIMVLGPGSYKKFHSQVSKSTIGSHADRKVWILSSHLGITLALVPIFLQKPKHSEIGNWNMIWHLSGNILIEILSGLDTSY